MMLHMQHVVDVFLVDSLETLRIRKDLYADPILALGLVPEFGHRFRELDEPLRALWELGWRFQVLHVSLDSDLQHGLGLP